MQKHKTLLGILERQLKLQKEEIYLQLKRVLERMSKEKWAGFSGEYYQNNLRILEATKLNIK